MTAGKVQTVLGDVDPSSLGSTLTHEHLLVSLVNWRPGSARTLQLDQATRDPRAGQPLTLDNLGWIRRHWASHADNMRLDEEDVAIDEVRLFKDAGGGTIVDATNADLRRDPEAVARIARAAGVNVVLGTGNYVEFAHPPDMDRRTEQDLAEEMIADITEGCDGTKIKAGIVGEIGCSAPMTSNERKSLRAAARAQKATGAPLLVHPGRSERAPFEAMEVVVGAGGDPERTIMSHIDRTLFDQQDMIDLARTGCYVEFDLFGQESSYYPLAPIDMPNDAMRINHLQRLIAEGFADKLVIAHDICRKVALVKYGGEGYAHILENVVPMMRRKGMTEEQLESLLVRNPARILPMAPAQEAHQ